MEVYFEKESIWIFDSIGKLLSITMPSLIQKESGFLLENITWDQRKRFSDDKVNLPLQAVPWLPEGAGWAPRSDGGRGKIVFHPHSSCKAKAGGHTDRQL